MPFTSLDDILSEISNGKFNRVDWNKITGAAAYTAGRWYDFSGLAGYPVANAFAGTALAWTSCNETAGNGTQIFGLPNGGNVTPDTKHGMNVSAISAVATAVPGVLMLVDMQGYYPGINMNVSTAQTLTGTPTLRYTNGVGVRSYLVVTSTTGATAHNIDNTAVTGTLYTNSAGTTGRVHPGTISCTASAIVPHITHSGTAANNFGPFLPLASGDVGMRSYQQFKLTAASASASTAALILAVPILSIPITTAGVAAERDLINQLPSLPRIQDGACLVWLYFAGAATAASTNFYGSLESAWG
jgi:hypothetical protein